ncbi:hypothetical protein [Yinghuangia sp. YIM S09857]|uniref:hypothetical protein n=1 Tax=Yinghuangia sp. YIM S09857 TaxID=3436929 RepID=UPI003F5371C3
MDAAHSPAEADADVGVGAGAAAEPDGDERPAVDDGYCDAPSVRPLPPPAARTGSGSVSGSSSEVADCVYCGKPTEYPAAQRGVTLCPVCEWQDDQRGACSG